MQRVQQPAAPAAGPAALRQDLQRYTPDVFVSVPLMLDSLQSRVRAWGCSLMQLGASAAVPGLSLHGPCSPSCPTPFVALYSKRLPVLQPLSVACCYARCCPVAQAVKTLAKAREPQRKLAEALLGASGRYVKAARLLRGTDLRWVQAAECEGGRPSLCRCSQQWQQAGCCGAVRGRLVACYRLQARRLHGLAVPR